MWRWLYVPILNSWRLLPGPYQIMILCNDQRNWQNKMQVGLIILCVWLKQVKMFSRAFYAVFLPLSTWLRRVALSRITLHLTTHTLPEWVYIYRAVSVCHLWYKPRQQAEMNRKKSHGVWSWKQLFGVLQTMLLHTCITTTWGVMGTIHKPGSTMCKQRKSKMNKRPATGGLNELWL